MAAWDADDSDDQSYFGPAPTPVTAPGTLPEAEDTQPVIRNGGVEPKAEFRQPPVVLCVRGLTILMFLCIFGIALHYGHGNWYHFKVYLLIPIAFAVHTYVVLWRSRIVVTDDGLVVKNLRTRQLAWSEVATLTPTQRTLAIAAVDGRVLKVWALNVVHAGELSLNSDLPQRAAAAIELMRPGGPIPTGSPGLPLLGRFFAGVSQLYRTKAGSDELRGR